MQDPIRERAEFVGRNRYDINASDTAIRIRTERRESIRRSQTALITDESIVVVRGSALAALTAELARVRPIRRRRYWLAILIGLSSSVAGAFVVAEVFAFVAGEFWGLPFSPPARALGFIAGIGIGASVGRSLAGDHLAPPVVALDGMTLPSAEAYLVWRDLTPESRDQLFAFEGQPAEVLRAGIELIAQRLGDARRADRDRQEREIRDRAKKLLDERTRRDDGDTAF